MVFGGAANHELMKNGDHDGLIMAEKQTIRTHDRFGCHMGQTELISEYRTV